MESVESKNRKTTLILTYVILLCLCFGCASKDGQQDTAVVDTAVEEETETSLTPTRTKNIAFAIESENIFCICNGEKYGYLKKNGEEITYYTYDTAYPFSEGLGCVMVDGKYGFINENGEEAIPFIYEDAAPFQDGLAYFATEEEYGFMDKDGTPVFYLDCDSISSFKEGFAYFSIDGRYGYLDKTGQVVIDAEYSDADYFKDGLAFVEIDGYKGAVNVKGEIVIPVQYDSIRREDGYIFAISGDETEYYSLTGDVIPQEVYANQVNAENEDDDISDILLKNSITPRIELYWKLTHGKPMDILNTENEVVNVKKFATWGESDYRKTAKLYDVLQNGMPLLYCMEEPAIQNCFPLSNSALYDIKDNQLQCLVSGEECGGSLRGDYVCFFKDMESGKNLIGNQGSTGGFGGFATYGRIYDYETGNANLIFSYDWIMQSAGNYTEEELYNNACLFYDENDNPYTLDAILDAETVQEYLVNEERVGKDMYENACEQYRCFTLFE